MGCLKLTYNQEGEGLENCTVFLGGRLEKKEQSEKNCDDYYPFGLTFNSYKSGTENLYKFNGIEEEKETGNYQTLFRGYDPALGRFMQIDPMADFLPGINPYQFGFNNPVSMMDPDGLWPWNKKKKKRTKEQKKSAKYKGGKMGNKKKERQKKQKGKAPSSTPNDNDDSDLPIIAFETPLLGDFEPQKSKVGVIDYTPLLRERIQNQKILIL